ncbi:hypothetical protein GS424_010000 [Eggerthella guodeyinii]|uniref:Uncharacterized protein n=1 Tax=Eggerthella guodeyinii TaxID=2690837 RepID=A0A6L7IW57_9ACTN|nr:TasA family protein [Eggerthella guodeyinii]QOS66888.1 hypothetical protein GS424_010000 [Eggerthella guodeyinii]
METTNNRKLIASAALIVASVALLLGLTFAWFTDTAANRGNKIQAGTLEIELNDGSAAPLISGDGVLWEPGSSQKAAVTVRNVGSLWLKYRFSVSDLSVAEAGNGGDIADVLDVYKVDKAAESVTADDLTADNKIGTLAGLAADEEGTGDAVLAPAGNASDPAYADADAFTLVVKMREEAGNAYQNAGIDFTINVVAAQFAHETDGFGNNDYDAAATYPALVSSEAELRVAAAKGGVVELAADVALTESVTFVEDAALDLQGRTLTVAGGSQPINVASGKTLVIEGDGHIAGGVYANSNGNVVINAGTGFSLASSVDAGWAVCGNANANLTVNGGTYTATEKGAAVIQRTGTGGTLSVSDATVNVGVSSVMQSCGISSGASETVLRNVTVNAGHSTAVKLTSDYSSDTIRGGSFVTDKTAEGLAANPTIRYSGKLDISDASITRVGTGIGYYKTYPPATEVKDLTISNVSFDAAPGAAGVDVGVQ